MSAGVNETFPLNSNRKIRRKNRRLNEEATFYHEIVLIMFCLYSCTGTYIRDIYKLQL